MRAEIVNNKSIEHRRTHEYASYMLDAMETVSMPVRGKVACPVAPEGRTGPSSAYWQD